MSLIGRDTEYETSFCDSSACELSRRAFIYIFMRYRAGPSRALKGSRSGSNIYVCPGSMRNRSSSPYRQREVSSGSVRSGGSGGAQVNLGYGTNAWADSRRASSSVSQVKPSSCRSFAIVRRCYRTKLVELLPRVNAPFISRAPIALTFRDVARVACATRDGDFTAPSSNVRRRITRQPEGAICHLLIAAGNCGDAKRR